MFEQSVSYTAAITFGFLSFFSPCILPLIPAYFTFISGYSLEELTDGQDRGLRKKVIAATIFYVLGFTFVFTLLGASASYLGSLIFEYQQIIRIAGGVLIILLGLHMTGLLTVKTFNMEKRFHVTKRPLRIMGAFVVGMAFAAGWSPCIGPLLGSILILAGSEETVWKGMLLLLLYSAGLATPFLVLSIFINYLLTFLKRVSRTMGTIQKVAGGLLIMVGIGLVTNTFGILSRLAV